VSAQNVEHPAPWEWGIGVLMDASGDRVLFAEGPGHVYVEVPSPLARELIRLAPELEELLRKATWTKTGRYRWSCSFCEQVWVQVINRRAREFKHQTGCPVGDLLEKLDAARKTP
jgi:hypothetical protein